MGTCNQSQASSNTPARTLRGSVTSVFLVSTVPVEIREGSSWGICASLLPLSYFCFTPPRTIAQYLDIVWDPQHSADFRVGLLGSASDLKFECGSMFGLVREGASRSSTLADLGPLYFCMTTVRHTNSWFIIHRLSTRTLVGAFLRPLLPVAFVTDCHTGCLARRRLRIVQDDTVSSGPPS